MSAPAVTIDLAEVRHARDAAVRLGREMAQSIAVGIAARTTAWCERAHAVSGPLLATDPDAARAMNRWALRRLKAEVKRSLPSEMPIEGRIDVLATVEAAFTNRMVQLAGGHIVVGEGQ